MAGQPGGGTNAWWWLGWAFALLALGNATVHLLAVCRPLISSDNWWLLDPFLWKAVDGTLGLGDFLVKRTGVDHAQPLGKLVVWLNWRLWDLDFVFEGLVALGFALAGLLVLARIVRSDAPAASGPAVPLLFAAIGAVYVSLNSTMIYTYSMVTLWFSLYLFVFLAMHAGWRAANGGHLLPLALVMAAYGIIGDDSAIMLGMALAMALLLHGWRVDMRRGAWGAIAVIAATLVGARALYLVAGTLSGATDPAFSAPAGARLQALWALRDDAWAWWAAVSSSGIAGIGALKALFGESWLLVRNALAALLLLAHAWFWWAALRLRPGATWFAAVTLMLLYYAHVAGLLLGRVFLRGTVFLEQPRYVSFYQLGIIALLLMAMAALAAPRTAGARGRWPRGLGVALAVALLAVQVPLTRLAQERVPSLQRTHEAQARAIAAVVRNPVEPGEDCTHMVCRLPKDRRVAWAGLLAGQQLNLYSPRFQARHPRLAAAAGLAPDAGATGSGSSDPSRPPASPR